MNIPIHAAGPDPVLVKIGTIAGLRLYIELDGSIEERDRDYVMIRKMIMDKFVVWGKDD